jgi:hypothetical protein
MKGRARSILIAVAVLLSMSVAPGAVQARDPNAGNDADTVSTAISNVAPNNDGVTILTPRKASDGTYGTSGAAVSVTIPADAGGVVVLRRNAQSVHSGVQIGLPANANRAVASQAHDGTVAYSGDNSTTAVQALGSGVRILTVIESNSAPTEFVYAVGAPSGRLSLQPDGGVWVLGADGSLLGGFMKPWAKDHNGADVPTRFDIRGNNLVQVVDHQSPSVVYPVVADPYMFIDLIDHATYVYHSGYGGTLQVFPTPWGRINYTIPVGAFAWDELSTKYPYYVQVNANGMRDQLICHWVIAAHWINHPSYNLDYWRPDVGFAQTVNANCNPGGSVWFD